MEASIEALCALCFFEGYILKIEFGIQKNYHSELPSTFMAADFFANKKEISG